MRAWGLPLAALTALLLPAVGVPTAAAAAPTAAVRSSAAPVGGQLRIGYRAPAGTAPPCPNVSAPATRPPQPPPPAVPAERVVGGPALATAGLVVPAESRPPGVTATSWLVADLDTGQVLGGCGPHEYGTPASVQKLLLAATMLPRLDPNQVVTVTDEDMDIEPGSRRSGWSPAAGTGSRRCGWGCCCKSGNEAANVLARLGGGPDGAAGGVRAMNE